MSDMFADFPIGTAVTIKGLESERGQIVAHYEIVAAAPNHEDLPTRILGIAWNSQRPGIALWRNSENPAYPLVKVDAS